jgi:hypothetical protein
LQNKHKKNLYKIIFLVIVLSFIISLTGCDWFSSGLFNIFDPQAIIKVDYTLVDLIEGAGSISLEIYSLNGVGFNASGFSYEYYYYSGITKIPIFTKVVEANFCVEPSISPGTPGPITTVDNLPLYFQDLLDWLTSHPLVTEVNCDLNLIGKDTSNHSQIIPVTSNLPVLQPGIDFYPPTAVISVLPDTTGTAPFTVVFDASGSTDVESGIVSYEWDFGDETTGTGITVNHTYENSGLYFVTLTVTDLYGNEGYKTETITVTKPEIEITIMVNPQANIPGGSSIITAIVTYKDTGDFVPDCTTVYFHTNSGTLSAGSAYTTNGMAKVTLTLDASMQVDDIATVTAFIGAVSNSVNVTCTEGAITEEITLSANPESNVPGGSSIITAIVTKKTGGFVDDGTTVYFTTNSGELSADSVTTVNGVATVELTLDDNMEEGANAKVTAFTLNSESVEVTVKCIEPIVTIYADDYSITTTQKATITAVVTKTDGTPIDPDVIVIFFAKDAAGEDIGTLNPVNYTTVDGIAETELSLDTIGDVATVTAKCGSRVSNEIVITCE